ncbi:MAG: NAD(P)H-dependent oxidoreductase subunit E [Candidatus Magnetoovum sp. WYHC-5]|nr:NAD(P)H-dependent oxidoreductase subunit E [Candidatus Magnetoovum sp. WYHC-5]
MKEILDKLIDDYRVNDGNVVSMLQKLQDEFSYIPEEAVTYISEQLLIPASSFYGVATFYSQFYLKPRGKNVFVLCCGTACHVKGSEKLINRLTEEFHLSKGQDTTTDNLFTLEKVACVGACSIAPVSIINKKINGKSTISKLLKTVNELRNEEERGKTTQG